MHDGMQPWKIRTNSVGMRTRPTKGTQRYNNNKEDNQKNTPTNLGKLGTKPLPGGIPSGRAAQWCGLDQPDYH
jgi:hypothetical protein